MQSLNNEILVIVVLIGISLILLYQQIFQIINNDQRIEKSKDQNFLIWDKEQLIEVDRIKNESNEYENISLSNLTFDKLKFVELSKNKDTLKSDNDSLELSYYQAIFEGQIYYNRKDKYLSLVKEYISSDVSENRTLLFIGEFYEIFKNDNLYIKNIQKEIIEQGTENLNTFYIDAKSYKFSLWIQDIQSLCECFTFSPEDSMKITSYQFRTFIQDSYLQIQDYLVKEE
jgi:hypothetical protein